MPAMLRPGLLLLMPAQAAWSQGLCIRLQCAVATHVRYRVASGSMRPTPEPGDCVIARCLGDDRPGIAAGQRVSHLRPDGDLPFPGRIVATGWQTVAMTEGRLVIDGVRIPVEPRPDYEVEMIRRGVADVFRDARHSCRKGRPAPSPGTPRPSAA
jgi:hypothetical protein